MVRKVYKKLTRDQVRRGVVFSSTLSEYREEMHGDTVHEIKGRYPLSVEKQQKVERLLDDKFFNESHFRFNIVRKGNPKKKLNRVI